MPPTFTDAGLIERIRDNPLPAGGLYVVGPCGSHKTHLAAARAVDAARRGNTARLVRWDRLAAEPRSPAGRGRRRNKSFIDEVVELDYLALDDLGVGRPGGVEPESSLKLAFQILDHRYAHKLLTDVTTNLTPDELAARFDERVTRRLLEMCELYPMLLREGDISA